MKRSLTAVSMFGSGGIGDLALRACGWKVIAANELLADRAALFRANHPDTRMVVGDIRSVSEELRRVIDEELNGEQLDVLFATPPCQGMSKNGMGKLLRERREGRRGSFDDRNQLVVPVIELVERYRPQVLVMENVAEMSRTVIETERGAETIEEFMHRRLRRIGYVGDMSPVEFADYGVPQRRKRLITIFSSHPALADAIGRSAWLPRSSHGSAADLMRDGWRTVDDAIAHLPPLDASAAALARSDHHPLHRVPLLDADKYFWVANTPTGATAFDNQCVASGCGDNGNPGHGTARTAEGINRSHKHTPVRCRHCGELLPRPWVIDDGEHRIMSGFTSAYKRMRGNLPASALTTNLSYACSDQKLHPRQHRVLSLHEAEILHTIDQYDWRWERDDGVRVSDKLVRDVIGESVPPKGLEVILKHLAEYLTRSDIKKE